MAKNDSEIVQELREQFELRTDEKKATLIEAVKHLLEEQESLAQLIGNECTGRLLLEPQGKVNLAMSKQKLVIIKVLNYFEQTMSAFLQPVKEEEQDNAIRSLLTETLMDIHAKGNRRMIEDILKAYQERRNEKIAHYAENLPNFPNCEDPVESLEMWMEALNIGRSKDSPYPSDMTKYRGALESINLLKHAFIMEDWEQGFVEYLKEEFYKDVKKVAMPTHYRFEDASLSRFTDDSVDIIVKMLLAGSPVIPYTKWKEYNRSYHSPVPSTTNELMLNGQMKYCSPYLYFHHYGKISLVKKASVYFIRQEAIASQKTKEPLSSGLNIRTLPVSPKTSEQICTDVRQLFTEYFKDCSDGRERDVHIYMPNLVDNLHDLYEKGKSEMKKCLHRIEAKDTDPEHEVLLTILSPFKKYPRSKEAPMDQLLSQWNLDATPTVNHTPYDVKATSIRGEASSQKLSSPSDMEWLGNLCKEQIRSVLKKKASSQMDKIETEIGDWWPSSEGRDTWEEKAPDVVVDMMFAFPPIIPVCSKTKHFPQGKSFNPKYHDNLPNAIMERIAPHPNQPSPPPKWYTPLLMNSSWKVYSKALYYCN